MKKSSWIRFMSLMLILTMISSVYMSTTIARFSDVVQSSDTTRVAIWDINASEVTMDLFNTVYTDEDTGNILAKSHNTENIIAPGTHGESLFSIVNHKGDIAPEVMYYIQIDLDDSQVSNDIITNSNIQWKLDNGSWGTWDQLKIDLYSLSGSPSGIKTYQAGEFADAFKKDVTHKISWQWLKEDVDANTMTDDEDYTALISVKVTAKQTSTVYTNAVEGSNNIVNVAEEIEPVVVKSSAPLNELIEVKVNDETVDDNNYTLTEGSTIVTFKSEYLETLPVGGYTVSVVSQKQTVSAKLDIVDRVYSKPGHGDSDEIEASTTLSENSWETISKVVKAGEVAKYGWKVGDKTTVDVDGTDYEVAIAGIDHDGENTVTFVFTESLGVDVMNDEVTNSGSWKNSKMKTVTMTNILNQMENKNFIKEVEKLTIKGYTDGKSDGTIYELITSNDKLFLLSRTEVFGGDFGEGTQYEYFKTLENRVIEPYEDESSYDDAFWLLRTPSDCETNFYYVTGDGYCGDTIIWGLNIVPAFVIG